MDINMNTLQTAAKALGGWDDILVISHASPDGDTLGSAYALIRGLISMGKNVSFACGDQIAKKYSYLSNGIHLSDKEPKKVVTVDVADIQLLGSLEEKYTGKVDIAIDHHATHRIFAKENWVDSTAAATTQMIYELLIEMDVKITHEIASCLYTGLSTDTGCFRYSNVNGKTHETAAKLIDLGAKASEINRIMFDTKTRACIEVEREVLKGLEFTSNGRIVCANIPHGILEKTGAKESDLDGIPSLVRGIEGVLIGITLKEKENGVWKASVRAISPANASEICQSLGGGGHMGAAGCSLGSDFTEAKRVLLAACEKHLNERSL